MGISRDSVHKRRKTGGRQKRIRMKRKFEMGRQPAATKIGERKISTIRVRGGNLKFRALRLDHGNFSWASEAVTRKTRIYRVVYNATNNELVRTNTLVKGSIVLIDSAPFKSWYLQYYNVDVAQKDSKTTEKEGKVEKETKGGAKEMKGVKETKGGAKESKGGEKEGKGGAKAGAKDTKGATAGKETKGAGKETKGAGKETKGAGKDTKGATGGKDTKAAGKDTKAGAKETKAAGKETKAAGKDTAKAGAKETKAGGKDAKGKEGKGGKDTTEKDTEEKKGKDKPTDESELGKTVLKKIKLRNKNRSIEQHLVDQFKTGRLYAKLTSRPGQCGRADGYILEGEELAFYLRKMNLKKKK